MRRRSSSKGQISAISARTPDSANMRATSPARRTFSVRSWSEKPRSALSPWRRLSPSSRKAGRPLLTKASSTAEARVDLPAPDRPVNRSVPPGGPSAAKRSARESRPPWRTTFGLAWVVAITRMTPAPTVPLVDESMTMKLPVARFVV